MKKFSLLRQILPVLCVVAVSAGVVFGEVRFTARIRKLRRTIAEDRAVAERSAARSRTLAELLGEMQEERERIEKLPLSLTSSDALTGIAEQCAMAAGVGCAVSASERDAETTALDLSLRCVPQELLFFLRELLARRAFFLVERIECRRSSDSLMNVRLVLTAFSKGDAS